MSVVSADGPIVGVDLGGTKILARLVDPATGRAIGRQKSPTPSDGPESVVAAILDLVTTLDAAGEAVAVGIGVPGFVVDRSIVVRCANIEGWDDPVDVGALVSAALDKPVIVGNDVDCGAVAEHRLGAGEGIDDLLAVFVGTGVGGGLILDGSLVQGTRGMVGEIGHVTVVPGGRPCGCGGFGHLEAYAGRAGMERRARELAAAGRPSQLVSLAGPSPIKSRHLSRALDEGDEVANELLDEAVEALAQVIGNAITLLDLQRVVLGGGVVDKLGQPLLDRISGSSHFGGLAGDICELRLARRLDDAGVVGAALLAADQLARPG
ncbi:MAG: ROK family protein [Acidimicrobiales bacterium]